MKTYRLYCLDGLGKIGHVEPLQAEDDEDAVRQAYARRLSVSCEVWDRDRLVSHIRAYVADEQDDA